MRTEIDRNTTAGRDGFALAITLVFMLVLTATVVAALNQASAERSVLVDADAGLNALVRAETGLNRAIETWSRAGSAPADGETLNFDLDQAQAVVVLHRLRPEIGGTPPIYAITSRGVYTRRGRAGAPDAARTVARLAAWVEGEMDVEAGWVALNGLVKNGSSGTINGHDGCSAQTSLAGVAVPETPGYQQNGSGTPLEGSPPDTIIGATATEAAAHVDIDWLGIVSGDVLEPDYILENGSTWPTIPLDEWPIIYIDNPGERYQLNDSGRGTIVVRGDMELNGGRTWTGIVLIGGQLTVNGSATIEGAAVSGLNVKLGENPDASEAGDVANGDITVEYNSCHVASSLERFSELQVYDNTWTDSWATY